MKKIKVIIKKHHQVIKKFLKGFTLIELLVVIAIIGILGGVVLTSVNSARAKARDSKRIQDIAQINTAINLYIDDHGGTPPDLGDPSCVDLTNSDATCFASTSEGGITKWNTLAGELQPYMSTLPTDPCPTCTDETFEYVYHAPAAVNAYFAPTLADFSSQSYSIYANALEEELGSTGFGESVPETPDEETPEEETPPAPAPTVNISANPTTIESGSSNISWSSTNATDCTGTNGSVGWPGYQDISGAFNSGNLASDTTFTLTCTGAGGSVMGSVTVNVILAAP